VSPRRGGEADKFGNRYEGRWTVRQLLYVLLGRVDSVRVEEVGDIGAGAEFTVRRGDHVEVHQVKRQTGNANEWSIAALKTAGVLRAAETHVTAGRQFHFVSLVPARALDELTDHARRSDDVQAFRAHQLTKELTPDFNNLCRADIWGSAESAWQVLRGMHIRWPDEREVIDGNSAFAGLLLEGAPPVLAAVGLGDLVLDHLNETLDAAYLESLLNDYGLRRTQLFGSTTLAQDVRSVLDRWSDSVARELLIPMIDRTETAEVWQQLQADVHLLLVTGTAGGGKSAVAYGVVQVAQSSNWPVLAFRLDRLGSFSSSAELGEEIGLTTRSISPVSALAAGSHGRPCLLLIDQIDAVSLASGRMPASFEVIATVLREALAFPNMRVLLACRKFDLENDERIRTLPQRDGGSQVEVMPLSDDQVNNAVQALGLPPNALTAQQRDLLRSPFNLALLRSIADQTDALAFDSPRSLLDAYWDRKRRNCLQRRALPVHFDQVIRRLVEAMSQRQRLAVPITILDEGDLADDAQVLESEHVLVRDGQQYAFFHEAFFDYAFARQWINRGQTLVDFLLGSDQELFRRGQVRQVLSQLHGDEPGRFLEEVEALLTDPQIRFHIKDVVLAMLRALFAPSSDEWAMVRRVIDARPEYVERLWLSLRTRSR